MLHAWGPVRPKSCRLQECNPCSSRRAGMDVGACATSIRSVSLVLLPKGRKKYRASRRAISPGPSSRRAKSKGSMWAESWCALRARLISPRGGRVLPAWMCAFSAISTVQMAIATRKEKAMQIPPPNPPRNKERPFLPRLKDGSILARPGENKVGGNPAFLQGPQYPENSNWRLLLQMDSANVPFYVN